jgi:hypothetical protein
MLGAIWTCASEAWCEQIFSFNNNPRRQSNTTENEKDKTKARDFQSKQPHIIVTASIIATSVVTAASILLFMLYHSASSPLASYFEERVSVWCFTNLVDLLRLFDDSFVVHRMQALAKRRQIDRKRPWWQVGKMIVPKTNFFQTIPQYPKATGTCRGIR